jgi:DNA ligase-1
MAPWQYIEQLEATNSRLEKEAILAQALADGCVELFEGARLALDSLITFGIKKVPTSTRIGDGVSFQEFVDVVTRLSNRTLTGNAARDAVEYLSYRATKAQWDGWYRRILIKDLRCGVTEKTINKVAPKNLKVPVFECQLAHDGANHESKILGRKMVEVKLDGVRTLAIVRKNGDVEMFSRNGKQFHNFEHIANQISDVAKQYPFPEDMVLDGEVMSSSFQDLMKQVHRKDNVAASDAVLFLFDILPLSEFQAGKSKREQIERSGIVGMWVESYRDHMPNVNYVTPEIINLDTTAGEIRFKEINANALAGGYEGIMIKDPHAKYECKRTTGWLKSKPFIEVSERLAEGVAEGGYPEQAVDGQRGERPLGGEEVAEMGRVEAAAEEADAAVSAGHDTRRGVRR